MEIKADPIALLHHLCQSDESEWLEFKVSCATPTEIGEYISALANSAMLADRDRGHLVLGVADKTKEYAGTEIRLGKLKGKGNEGFKNWVLRKLSPQPHLEYLAFESEGKHFEIICIEPSYERPVAFDDKAYIRIGEHKKLLKDHPSYERTLWLATSRRRFEDSTSQSNVSLDDIERTIDLDSFYNLTERPKPKSIQHQARNLEDIGALTKIMEGRYDILNLGAILFAKDVVKFPSIKRKSVRVIQYKGKDKRLGEPEREERTGYATGFSQLVSYVMMRITEETYIDGVRRGQTMIPEIGVRESVANALIHQE